MTFNDTSIKIAEDFIQSAVIIDDDIIWPQRDFAVNEGTENEDDEHEQKKKIDANDKEVIKSDEGVSAKVEKEELEQKQTAASKDNEISEPDDFDAAVAEEVSTASPVRSGIYGDKIVKSFCKKGIVCSPYIWEDGHEEIEFPSSTEKADLLIVDWKLENPVNKGKTATKLLRDRLEEDLKASERLRFISIYTTETQKNVFTDLIPALEQVSETLSIEEQDTYLDIVLNKGSQQEKVIWRIIYVPKSLKEEKLAEHLLEGFANFIAGYMPIAVLAAVSEIRKKTPEYLAKFNRKLDVPIISHLTSLRNQKDLFHTGELQFRQYVVNLIGDVIVTDLHHSSALKSHTQCTNIAEFLKGVSPRRLHLPDFGTIEDENKVIDYITMENYEEYKESMFADLAPNRKKKDKFEDGKVAAYVTVNTNDSLDDFDLLAENDLFERTQKNGAKRHPLKMGTIFASSPSEGDKEYFVCIQPVCDSVRLPADDPSHPFPCLKLEAVETGKFHFVIFSYEEFIRLKADYKPRNIEMLQFKSEAETTDVRFADDYKLTNVSDNPITYEWLGELKNIYAQEVLNTLAASGSRVGSDKFEWLRKQG